MPEKKETIELDLWQLLRQLLQHIWIIVLATILTAALFFGYAQFFVTPMYASSIQLYVNNDYGKDTEGFDSSQLTAAAYLAETYMVILYGKPVMNAVLEQTDLPYTVEELRGMVKTDTVNETEIFEVTVTCPNSQEAAGLANAFAEVLPEKIAEIVDGSSVRLVDYAVASDVMVSPNYFQYTLIGATVGFLLSIVAILLKEVLDDGIYSEEYLTVNYSDLPLLAVVPDVQQHKNYKYYKGYYTTEQKTRTPSR